MSIESERKFLVLDDSWRSSVNETVPIRQGYLTTSTAKSVRIRTKGEAGFLTIKSGLDPLSRLEFEYEIPILDARKLLDEVCERPIVDKSRHVFTAGSGLVWEIDEFHGHLDGLTLAEIELSDEVHEVELPAWVGEEVTHDPRYLNANLVKSGPPGRSS